MSLLVLRICFTGLTVLLGVLTASAQPAPNWEWIASIRTTVDVSYPHVAIDAVGNSYVAGGFSGRATFGNISLTSRSSDDIFVAKYDAQGKCLWARQGSPASATPGQFSGLRAYNVAVDSNGSVYVVGLSSGRTAFDNAEITTVNDQFARLFLVKYSSQGIVAWARTYDLSSPGGIAVDGDGNIYITHSASPVGGVEGSRASKLDPQGNAVWTRGVKGPHFGNADSQVKIGPNREVYISGSYRFGTRIDVSAQASTPLSDAGLIAAGLMNTAVFLARYTANGTLEWVRTGGAPGADTVNHGLAIDGVGNAFITGITTSGGAVFGSTALAARGDQDVYVAKYDAQGGLMWARQEGGSTYDNSADIAVDDAGNSYLAGYFYNGQATFGDVRLTGGAVFGNLILAKYTPQGSASWVMTQQGGGNMFPTALAINSNGDAYITGEFQNTIRLGAQSGSVSSPLREVFVAKLKSNLPLVIPSSSLFIPNIITPNGDGHNDQFKIRGLEAEGWNFTVYNRWGTKVFEAPDYQQDWQAEGLGDGIYYYVLENRAGDRKKGWLEVRR